MRVFTVLFILFSLSAANQLLSTSEIDILFRKFMLKQLNEEESLEFQDVLDVFQRPQYSSDRSLGFSGQARTSLECIICRSVVRAAIELIRDGASDEDITESIVLLCTNLGIMTHNVCLGAVSLNMPIIAHIFRTTPEATADAFCGLILQNSWDENNSNCPFSDPRFEWQVELPDRSDVTPNPPFNQPPLKIAIITDFHVDPLYEANGVAECDEPTCCRLGQTPARSFLYQSNIDKSLLERRIVEENGVTKLNLSIASEIRDHMKTSRTMYQSRQNPAPAGFWGDYRNCDTPIWAFDDAIETIHENHGDVDAIYYIGDTIDHGIWETTYESVNSMNRYVVEKIRKTFGDGVLVVPVLGNHDTQPTNQFAPLTVVGEKLNTTWLYEALVDKWGFYLPDEAKQSLLKGGDFSLIVRPGLRIISLNNNVAYRDNWWLLFDPLDAKKHLDWLISELYAAEVAGEKVHILAHIPPGVADLTYTWTREYNRIVNRFSDTIAAEFNGHTHSDEFKVFYSPGGTPINVAWGAGSLTAYTYYNLNYKIATFEENTYVPDNIINYVYNLTEANTRPDRRPHWFMLYNMKNSFQLTDLSVQSIHNLIYSMVTENRILLHLYSAFYSKISDGRWPNCDDNCKVDDLCKTVVTVLWERGRCNELRELFFGQ